MKHLSMAVVEALVGGSLKTAARKRAVRHLLSGCRLCGGRLAAAAPDLFFGAISAGSDRPEEAYDAPIDRAMARARDFQIHWRRDRERLVRCLDLIRKHPQGYDGLSFEQVQEFQGRPLIEALLQLSFEARFQDPKLMRCLAYHAMTAAEGLQPEEYGVGFTYDLRARAWAELGNAYRVNDEFAEAEEAFERARGWLRQGSADPLLLARVANLEADLRDAQRRMDQARGLLEGVHRLCAKLGDHHLAGRALVSKGLHVHFDGDPRQAITLLREGVACVDPEREPQLPTICRQSILNALVDCCEFSEAGRLLLEGGLRQACAAEPLNLLKLRWLEGRLLAGLGRLTSAERALLEARNGFLERGLNYRAALAGLDLASVWLRQGKTAQVRQLSRDLLLTFRALGIRREAVQALRYFEISQTSEPS